MEIQGSHIAVMGAGAVGSYFGARLVASGQDVAFIGRGNHLEAMRQDGLKIKSPQGNFEIRSLFASSPEEIGPVDWILFCVKAYDTDEVGKRLAPLMGEKTTIISLQNGVDNPSKLAELWGENRILAGIAYIGVRISSPGVIEHTAGGRILLGELDGKVSKGTKAMHQILSGAQISCTISTEIRKAMWGKLVWNTSFCAISCLTRATVKEILESDSLRKLAVDCMEEVREAAKCQGLDLGPSIVAETLDLSHNLGDFKPSMLQDLEAGKPLEHQAFNGVVVDILHRAGKGAPINEIFVAALKSIDAKVRDTQVR